MLPPEEPTNNMIQSAEQRSPSIKNCDSNKYSDCGDNSVGPDFPARLSPTSVLKHLPVGLSQGKKGVLSHHSRSTTLVSPIIVNGAVSSAAGQHVKPPRYCSNKQHRRNASLPNPTVNDGRMTMETVTGELSTSALPKPENEILFLQKVMTGKDGDRARQHNQLGTIYFKRGEFNAAYDSYSLASVAPGADSDVKAITYQNIGTTEWKLGQFENAVTSFRNSLHIRLMQQQQQPHKPQLIGIAHSFQNLGLALILVQKLEEATASLDRAFEMYVSIAQSESIHAKKSRFLDIARRVNSMGCAIEKTKFADDKALKYHHFALQLKYEYFGTDTITTSSSKTIRISLMEIGQLNENLLNYENAMNTYQAALELVQKQQLLEENDSVTIERGELLFKIGLLNKKMGNFSEAFKFFHDAAFAYAEAGLPHDNECMYSLMESMKS